MAKRAVSLSGDLDDDSRVHNKVHKVDNARASADDVCQRWQERYGNYYYYEVRTQTDRQTDERSEIE